DVLALHRSPTVGGDDQTVLRGNGDDERSRCGRGISGQEDERVDQCAEARVRHSSPPSDAPTMSGVEDRRNYQSGKPPTLRHESGPAPAVSVACFETLDRADRVDSGGR